MLCPFSFPFPGTTCEVQYGGRATKEPLSMQIHADAERERCEVEMYIFSRMGGLIGLQLKTGRCRQKCEYPISCRRVGGVRRGVLLRRPILHTSYSALVPASS